MRSQETTWDSSAVGTHEVQCLHRCLDLLYQPTIPLLSITHPLDWGSLVHVCIIFIVSTCRFNNIRFCNILNICSVHLMFMDQLLNQALTLLGNMLASIYTLSFFKCPWSKEFGKFCPKVKFYWKGFDGFPLSIELIPSYQATQDTPAN